MTFRSRSWVIGRGVVTFSIWSAIAFASGTPTQIGSTRCSALSRRMMIGMFVIGSTISPLIVISICMISVPVPVSRTHHSNVGTRHGRVKRNRLASETVRRRAGDPHPHDLTDLVPPAGEVHHGIAAGAARYFPVAPATPRVHQDV